jgi:hypothetical protein
MLRMDVQDISEMIVELIRKLREVVSPILMSLKCLLILNKIGNIYFFYMCPYNIFLESEILGKKNQFFFL